MHGQAITTERRVIWLYVAKRQALLLERKSDRILGFPGGERNRNEPYPDALRRILRDQFNIWINLGSVEPLDDISFEEEGRRYLITPFRGGTFDRTLRMPDAYRKKWCTSRDREKLPRHERQLLDYLHLKNLIV